MPTNISKRKISPALRALLEDFLETVPANQFKKRIMMMFFAYLKNTVSEGTDFFFSEFVDELAMLFLLLDAIEDEQMSKDR